MPEKRGLRFCNKSMHTGRRGRWGRRGKKRRGRSRSPSRNRKRMTSPDNTRDASKEEADALQGGGNTNVMEEIQLK